MRTRCEEVELGESGLDNFELMKKCENVNVRQTSKGKNV